MTPPPFSIEETDHLWIGMSDGTRLAARLWRPRTDQPVPALLEYIPYRKSDMVRGRDERNHPFFAAHGYACIRVDMRGSGDSDGAMPDMYTPEELDDARQVIDWLAAQPWCSGDVGMFGTSWGGTASLQACVDAPKALKAVIAVCATHDRFEDDIHYMGGCVLSDTFEWGATLPAILASPPTTHAGSDWQDLWRARINNLSFSLENWLHERGRGAYWRHGSVIHEAGKLNVPILSIGGWSDRYSNSVMSLVDARPDLVWGVVGPWGHHYPDQGAPGPAIGFQDLALEWWDRWLNPEGSGGPDWPRMRAWLREFDPPHDSIDNRAGQWIESDPPGQVTDILEISLADVANKAGAPPLRVPSDPLVGMTSGDTGYFGRLGGLPLDQSTDDARSLVFETDVMDADVVLYGGASISIQGSVSNGPAQIVARLSDVAPDGTTCRISYGMRNLALDARLDASAEVVEDGAFGVTVPLHTTAYRLRKGHRLRIAISNALWPLVWSGNHGADMSINAATILMRCLTAPPIALQQALPVAKELPSTKTYNVLKAPKLERWKKTIGPATEIGWYQPMTQVAYPQTDTVFGYSTRMVHCLNMSDHPTKHISVDHSMEFRRADGIAQVQVKLDAKSCNGSQQVRIDLNATWNGEEIGQRTHSFACRM